MKIGFIGSKNHSFDKILRLNSKDDIDSFDYLLVDHDTLYMETKAVKVFFGSLEKLNYSNPINVKYFFSSNKSEKEVLSFLEKKHKELGGKSKEPGAKAKKNIGELKKELQDKEDEVLSLKEGSIEIKGLREYVVRLMSVNTVEQLVYETERLRVLRYKGVRLSLIYTDDDSGFLCTKSTLRKIPISDFHHLQKKMNSHEDLKKNLANILFRPVLGHFHFKIHELNEKEKIYVLFESDSDFYDADFFLNMLFKLMITNFVRVLQSEKLFKISSLISLAFSQIQDICILVGKDYEIKVSNQKEAVGKKCFNYIFKQNTPCENCPMISDHDLKNSSHELEEQEHIVHASNLPDFKGLYHLHIYESKVSSLKRESLKIQRGKLQSLGMVTTALTHELNNPLTGIFELSKDLEEMFEGQTAEDFLEVSKAAKRCLLIIENLKNFSSKKIDFERIQLSKVIQDALSLAKIMLRGVRLNSKLDPEIWISGSSTIISQAVFNIVKNSIEAMDYKGEIELSLKQEGKEVCVHFQDNGPGLPEGFNEIALFGTQKKNKGAGYGMFLVHEFVKLHGGRLTFGSNEGQKGAYFKMYFPMEV